MKKHLLTGLLGLQAIGWTAATIQGVLLQISPKGVSPDAFLFGAFFGLIAVATGALAWAVHRRKRVPTIVVTIGFVLAGAGGLLSGAVITLVGFGATDSYVLPIGLLALGVGVLHLGAAWLGWSVLREVNPPES